MQFTLCAHGCEPPARLRHTLQRRMAFGLGRFNSMIRDVELHIERPEGTADHRCCLRVTVRSVGTVEAQALDTDCESAAVRVVDSAARRIQYELGARLDGFLPGVPG